MCCQQSTATNKLRYVEAWFADAELWHKSRWNQVKRFKFSHATGCPYSPTQTWFWKFNFLLISHHRSWWRCGVCAVWRQICSLLERLVACILQMQIVTTLETTLVVSWKFSDTFNLFIIIFMTIWFTIAFHLFFAALAEIAQSSTMVHVLIGEKIYISPPLHYWWTFHSTKYLRAQ